MYQLIKDLRTFEGAADCYAFGEYAHLKFRSDDSKSSERSVPASGQTTWSRQTTLIHDFLISKNHRNIEVKPAEPTVEDCFIELMKN
jgi:hypothetical protein